MTSTTPHIRIDFVSDIACPWCAVGLNSLEKALQELGGAVEVDLHFQPFELNPGMPPEGQDTQEHLAAKYGLNADQLRENREVLRDRGAAVGFSFGDRDRVYNTFDAHRLLHWAGEQGADPQRSLKHALLQAYLGDNRDVSSRAVLAEVAGEAGLDAGQAADVLASDRFAGQVREQQQLYQSRGIQAVPSVILDGQHLIQGGQPPELFVQALRQVAGLDTAAGPISP